MNDEANGGEDIQMSHNANPLTDSELAKLRRLEAAATPGDWEFQISNGLRQFGTPRGGCVARATNSLAGGPDIDDQDAALIVDVRNALPRLLDQAERLTAGETVCGESHGRCIDGVGCGKPITLMHRPGWLDELSLCELPSRAL